MMNPVRLCLFVHWDKDDIIDPYISEYLRGLKEVCGEIVFISNSKLSLAEQTKIHPFCQRVLIRENQGYDFGAWQDGLHELGRTYLQQFDEIVLANDSCYGSLFPFNQMFHEMNHTECDLWGITENHTPYTLGKKVDSHLQSYFLVFKKSLFHHEDFHSFYQKTSSHPLSFTETILQKEIGLTSFFKNKGYRCVPYLSDHDIQPLVGERNHHFKSMMHNRANYYWDLLVRKKSPLLKRKVFSDVLSMMFVNHYNIEDSSKRFIAIREFTDLLESEHCHIDVKIIVNHLKRTLGTLHRKLLFGQELHYGAQGLKNILLQFTYKDLFSFYGSQNTHAETVNQHYTLGNFFIHEKQYSDALLWMEKAYALAPENTQLKTIVDQLQKKNDDSSGLFNSHWYTSTYLTQEESHDAWNHFLNVGHLLGYQPNPNFHTEFYRLNYLSQKPHINPLLHYEQIGKAQGLYTRPPLPQPADIKSFKNHTLQPMGLLVQFESIESLNLLLPFLVNLPKSSTVVLYSQHPNITDFQHQIQKQFTQLRVSSHIGTPSSESLSSLIPISLELYRHHNFQCIMNISTIPLDQINRYLYNMIGTKEVISTLQSELESKPNRILEVIYSQPLNTFWWSGQNLEKLFTQYFLDSPILNNKSLLGLLSHLRKTVDFNAAIIFKQCTSHPLRNINLSNSFKDILDSKLFDEMWYLRTYPEVQQSNLHPIEHYLTYGFLKNYQPAPWFQFNKERLDGDKDESPLNQYLRNKISIHLPKHNKPQINRICLFAGYDKDGIIDDYVVTYIQEISRFADIHYLADSHMSDDELSKITPFVKSAQAIRHEKYDFGSYSKLASEIVGWKTISQYDELLFVNDSCYSLKSLSSVFEKMEQSNCDFWGIQLTKGMGISEKPTTPTDYDVNDFLTANQINEEVEELDQNPFWDLHVGSYFIAFRSNVFMDSDFQLAVESVTKESDKANIVIKYEMGWTHLLLKKGYHVDSFISKIYPFHPLFTEWYFKLLDEGMPLLKRFLLSENHYYLPNLYLWKNRIAPYTSNEVITEIQNNLSRTTDPKKLNYLHHIKN